MKKTTVLLTKSFSDEYLNSLDTANIEWLQHPFIAFNYKHLPDLEKQIQSINAPFIFTSQNAVIGFEKNAALSDERKKCFCLNGATQSALENSRWKILASANTSDELAEIIIQKNIREAIFCCGNIRMNVIPEKLHEAKIKLHEFVVYETAFNSKKTEQHFDAIVFFSPSAAESFFQKNNLHNSVKVYCLGNSTASFLMKKGFENILIPPLPSSDFLFKIIIDESQ